MMIDGPVDVSGSTIKIDNSGRLDNLYKVARKAKESRNHNQAYKYYEQLHIEDPDNWEPALYSAFYSAMYTVINDKPGSSVRTYGNKVSLSINYRSGISPCISIINNSLGNVFNLTEDIRDYEEFMKAVNTVSVEVDSICLYLKDIIEDEYERMRKEIIQCSYANNESDGAGIIIGSLEKSSYNKKNKWVRDSYLESVSNIQTIAQTKMLSFVEAVSKRRFEQYWVAKQDEKAVLEAERQMLVNQIACLNNDILLLPGYENMVQAHSEVDRLKQEKAHLGLFKKKKKAAKDAEIDAAIATFTVAYSYIGPSISTIQTQICESQKRVSDIEHELTRPR
jgi:tetratricopeptide (TPR) repeat protein